MIATSNLNGGRRKVSIKLGMAWGAMFQSPAYLSLAIRKAPRVGASALRLATTWIVSLSAGISRPVA